MELSYLLLYVRDSSYEGNENKIYDFVSHPYSCPIIPFLHYQSTLPFATYFSKQISAYPSYFRTHTSELTRRFLYFLPPSSGTVRGKKKNIFGLMGSDWISFLSFVGNTIYPVESMICLDSYFFVSLLLCICCYIWTTKPAARYQ